MPLHNRLSDELKARARLGDPTLRICRLIAHPRGDYYPNHYFLVELTGTGKDRLLLDELGPLYPVCDEDRPFLELLAEVGSESRAYYEGLLR